MSVHKKLNNARLAFHALELKKSGYNKFAQYKYFELGDFVIPAMKVFRDAGLCAVVSFTDTQASMTITDVDAPEQTIVITSPMGSAQLKGCHEVQNVGAVETYQRRYLWVAALEIVEHDAIDSSEPVKAEPKKAPIITATQGVYDSLPKEEQQYLEELANAIFEQVNHKDEAEQANERIKSENLDADQKTALWSLLDSKTRSALKKASQKEPA